MLSTFATRVEIESHQVADLSRLVADVAKRNQFWRTKWAGVDLAIASLNDLDRFPFTTKDELIADQEREPPYGTNLTEPRDRYMRFHQTSGTKGKPLRWLDTAESWLNVLACWHEIYHWAGVGRRGDRFFFPFSFGPFLGFWAAYEAAMTRGCLTIPAGGLSTGARLNLMLENEATVVCCTPTYAVHLAQTAHETGIDLKSRSHVKTLIVAGEPGGSVPATRARIEDAWQARVIDHYGLTEVGPLATEHRDRPGFLDVLEANFIAEVRDPVTLAPTPDGDLGELIVTNLRRAARPLIRYRTGDLVRPRRSATGFLRLEGGVVGRVDDMIPLRGNNFYPSSLEAVLRKFPEVVEYQVEVDTTSPLAELRIDVEACEDVVERIVRAIRDELLFRADVRLVPAGSLPRFEMKASRVRRK